VAVLVSVAVMVQLAVYLPDMQGAHTGTAVAAVVAYILYRQAYFLSLNTTQYA
jgi:hypothetical protein